MGDKSVDKRILKKRGKGVLTLAEIYEKVGKKWEKEQARALTLVFRIRSFAVRILAGFASQLSWAGMIHTLSASLLSPVML